MRPTDLTDADWQRLEALADEVVPDDDFFSASETGFREFLTRNWVDAIGDREDALRALLAGDSLARHDWFVRVVAESYYSDPENGGNYGSASFRMIGFDYRPQIEIPHELPYYDRPDIDALAPHYSVIVVGSGAGGGVVSRKLTEAGIDVLCIERGRYLHRADVPMDHLRNHRFARYGHNVGPELAGNPRMIVGSNGAAVERRPHQFGYSNNAMGVGGGTRVWGAQAWRFAPQDFRLASAYGVPDGSSLADWPFDYDALEPHYDWAEYAIGVAGEPGHRHEGVRSRSYPMPPHALDEAGNTLRNAAERLGWTTRAPPLAINSQDYDGRGPCSRNNLCVGFACPANARGGSQNALLPKAMATGRFTLATELRVVRVLEGTSARIRGVRVIAPDGRSREIGADFVVVSAGAIESARLLWLSGFGNHSGHLGRHLQAHLYVGARGDVDAALANGPGPGPNVATCEFNHANDGIVGGGMLTNDYPILPIAFWYMHRHRAPAPWGIANKRWMARAYRHTLPVMGPVQEIPTLHARVTIDPTVVDGLGIPVARVQGALHAETLRAGRFMREKAREWLVAAGARNVEAFGAEPNAPVGVGQHQAGTCRMGIDPAQSVTDPWGRVHEVDNLYVADASLHVTNGGFNPGLTVMAVASRVADGLIARIVGDARSDNVRM
jgi:choline dehydrogenase-like flavoprotein